MKCDWTNAEMRRVRGDFFFVIATVLAVMVTVSAEAQAQGVREFGVPRGKLPLRGFGNPEGEEALRVRFPEAAASITGDDRSLALKHISIGDGNGDGIVTTSEWAESGHQTPGHFRTYDLNGDGMLTLYEHCVGIAVWRRRNERRADEQRSAMLAAERKRTARTAAPAILKEAPQTDPQLVARQEQLQRLAAYLVRQYDLNEDGVIERIELQDEVSRFGNAASADRDFDGKIQADELADWLQSRLPPLSRLSLEFQSLDLDHDDQLTFREFSPVTNSTSLAEFGRWDRNGDGFITPRESHSPRDIPTSQYENRAAFVIKPGASVVSDIWIEDDLLIDRLQVRVRITKETDNFTALLLVGPGGKRVTLFAGDGWQPWRGAPILRGVTFDDAAPLIKETRNQPPYRRELRPPGKGTKDEPLLGSFRGQSTRGTWRLIVRNQNDRTGLLLDWSLIVTPKRASG